MKRAGLCLLFLGLLVPAFAQSPTADADLRKWFGDQYDIATRRNAGTVVGVEGWLFLAAEFRLLSFDRFWGDAAAKTARAQKPGVADPMPAILDFQKQLKARNIQLLLVPVPPKAAMYREKLPDGGKVGGDAMTAFQRFYQELRAKNVDVLDLSMLFMEKRADERGRLYCATDSHWSGVGCVHAAEAIAQAIRERVPDLPSARKYTAEWIKAEVRGDLLDLSGAAASQTKGETLAMRRVTNPATNGAIEADPSSPVLLLGDSHTLVFHDFLGERSGLSDQMTVELGFAPDVLGTRGSGATPVRANLLRRSIKEPGYLGKKKIVVWCFAAREFTEADQGWQVMPIAK